MVQIIEVASSLDEKVTPLKLLDTWMGKGPAKRRKMIQTTTLPRLQAEAVVLHLLLHDYLRYLTCFCFRYPQVPQVPQVSPLCLRFLRFLRCLRFLVL